jgi:AcrR family transcriptional regulator
MARNYRMKARADGQEQTRARILAATMALHDEKGVAATSLSDVAERAGVSASTVSRHFPTLGDLVAYCGMHVWQEMQPPTPDTAAAVFDGAATLPERLERLLDALDAFYARAAFRLRKAAQDRDRLPQLDAFLGAIDAGIAALIHHALEGVAHLDRAAEVVQAITRVEVWTSLESSQPDPAERRRVRLRLLSCAVASVAPG